MKASSAVQRLAETVAIVTSEYRKLQQRSGSPQTASNTPSKITESERTPEEPTSSGEFIDKEHVKATLGKMLEELSDIE